VKNPFLISENIYLSPLTKDDISEDYISWLNDSEVCNGNSHATFPNNYSKTLAYVESIENSKTEIVFSIRWKKNDIHIGIVSLQKINYVNRSGEITMIVGDKNYRNKGVGTEALKLLIDFGFYTLNLNRISGTPTTNEGGIKICENNKMKKECLIREGLFKNGKYMDAIIYSILLKDYKMKNKE